MPRYWIHSAPDDYNDDGQRECARAERCSDPRITDENGKTVRLPALTYRAFCEQDRTAVSKALDDLPMLWVRVHQRLDKSFAVAGGPVVSMSKSAPVPISLAADELSRLVLAILVAWEERVRTVARLKQLDTETSRRRRDGVVLSQAWTVLSGHLDALLSLPAEAMVRDEEVVELSGADAGLDVLRLAYRCRAFLTDTKQPARHLSGVYCDCGYPELYEVLDDHGQPSGARCRQCRDEYSQTQYADLVAFRHEHAKTRKRRRLQPAGRDDSASRRA